MATMTEPTTKTAAEITAKVASMSDEQAISRMFEIADNYSGDPTDVLEFAKLLCGPDAEVTD